jgi:hypothetical protein
MTERLIISPEVRAVLREGRRQERELHAKDRIEVPFGLEGEALRAEGVTPSRTHSNGSASAREAEQF